MTNCTNHVDNSQEEDAQKLASLLEEIIQMAENTSCTDDQNWAFTAFGTKACGGPVGYLIYSTTIDTEDFLDKVTLHAASQNEYNIKFGIVSDCAVPTMPAGVACQNGVPVLVY